MNKKLIKLKNDVRNWMHIVGFFTLAYKLIGLAELDFYLWQKIILGLVLSAIGYGAGHGYEGIRFMLFGDKTSNSDGNNSWLGFTLGSYLVLFVPGIVFINLYLFWVCFSLFLIDNIYAFYKKKQSISNQ